jgi:hypothetical protein
MAIMSRTVWSSVVNMMMFGLLLAARDSSPRTSSASRVRQAMPASNKAALAVRVRLNPCTRSSCPPSIP